jgi:hypothetical protein
MKKVVALFVVLMISVLGWAQTCTISGSGTINWTAATCSETGLAPQTGNQIIVPLSVTLNINNIAPTPVHIGNLVIFGTVINNKANARWDGNITIKSTGKLQLEAKLDIGLTAGCGYTLEIESGGSMTLNGSGGSDLLSICGKKIAQSGGDCNTCPEDPPSSGNFDCSLVPPIYCEPTGGFTGPTDFDENGVQPVELLYFTAKKSGNSIALNWATSMEEDFSHFVVQHGVNGYDYVDMDAVEGAGYNTESQNDYEYIHTLPLLGYNYYRLKAIDLNGSFEFFGPVVERFTGKQTLWIHPNPVSADKVEYKMNFTPNEGDRIQVYNGMGQVVADVPASQNAGVVYFTSTVQSGSYILKYSSSLSSYYTRFIVLE